MAFTERLLEETGVSIAPGTAFGAYGEGHVRISLGAATSHIKEALRRLLKWW